MNWAAGIITTAFQVQKKRVFVYLGVIREVSNVYGELSSLLSFRLVGKLTNRQASLGDTVVPKNRGRTGESRISHGSVGLRGSYIFTRLVLRGLCLMAVVVRDEILLPNPKGYWGDLLTSYFAVCPGSLTRL